MKIKRSSRDRPVTFEILGKLKEMIRNEGDTPESLHVKRKNPDGWDGWKRSI
jgi:hypothetical protein